jgi:hypothetical protein
MELSPQKSFFNFSTVVSRKKSTIIQNPRSKQTNKNFHHVRKEKKFQFHTFSNSITTMSENILDKLPISWQILMAERNLMAYM